MSVIPKLAKWSPFTIPILFLTGMSLLTAASFPGINKEPPEILPPVFSHNGGFFTEAFELTLETPYDGVYHYAVKKEGYESAYGEVTVTDEDVELQVILHQEGGGQAKEATSGSQSSNSFVVTFKVDMTDSPYQSGDTVYISGTMTDPHWPEPGSNEDMVMQPSDDEDMVYTLSFQLPPGDYAYKYFLHKGWGDGEWSGPPNREVSVLTDTTFYDIWGVIDPGDPDDPDDPYGPGTHTVTFVVTDQDGVLLDDAVITFDDVAYDPGDYIIEDVIPAADIRFTTDGSIPDSTSTLYTSPIHIASRTGDPRGGSLIPTNNISPGHHYNEHWQPPAGEVFKINTIRACALLPNGRPGKVATHSYLVDDKGIQRYSMPLISINAHAGAFFDADTGIYVYGNHNNYTQRGREWERLVHFEFFEENGDLSFAQNMGARIHGGTSRNRPRKSLRMYARSDYGTTWVEYPLFPDKEIDEYKRFLLRNSGNDWGDAIFRDSFMQSLLKDMNLDIQYSRPAIVFLNGEYWGVHNIRDRLDNRYLQTHYGLDDEMDYTILERHGQFERGNPDGEQHYWDMLEFLYNPGVSEPENYAELRTRMDVKNFTNYQIAQIYVMNTDWPGNNIQYWRYYTDTYNPDAPPGHDGLWRWQVFDLDFGFGLDFDYVTGVEEGPAHNTLAFALEPNGPSWPNPPWSTFILRSLMENDDYRHHFITRFADLLNTSFEESHVLAKLETYYNTYLPEMPEHIHRWRMPSGLGHWDSEIDVMRDFAAQRPDYMRQYMAGEFSLGAQTNLHIQMISPSQGSVRVNTIRIDGHRHPWTGVYFENMPIELEAMPAPGHRFSHWEGIGDTTNPNPGFLLEEETNVKAYFQDALIHYWHFNNLTEGTLHIVESDFSVPAPAVITYPGTGSGYMDRTDGTLHNTHHGAGAGYGLRARNPSDARQLTIHASSAGRKDLVFSFAARRTPNGAHQQAFYYSADAGENWAQAGDNYNIGLDYQVYTFDLSHLEEVNDNPDLRFKIEFLGDEASGADGNNRFDNMALAGMAIELILAKTNPLPGYVHETYPGHYFTASGGAPPYEYTLASGALPQGMQVASNGHLSGTPAEQGLFAFTITVTDDAGRQYSHEYTLRVEQKALIHYWHFNNLPDGTILSAAADLSMTEKKGIITYPGTGEGYMDRTDGTLLNSKLNAGAGYGLRVRNPSAPRKLVFATPSSEFENLTFSYAVHRTTNGARQQKIHYSPDGGITWHLVGEVEAVGPSYTLYSFDLSDYNEVNNNPDLQIKIVFTGEEASGSSGNNRFDNIAIHGLRHNVSVRDPGRQEHTLEQNFPNPFRGKTTISYKLSEGGPVRIDVFNLHGMHVANLVDEYKQPGKHEVSFDGSHYRGGVYIYRLQAPGRVTSRQMILLK